MDLTLEQTSEKVKTWLKEKGITEAGLGLKRTPYIPKKGSSSAGLALLLLKGEKGQTRTNQNITAELRSSEVALMNFLDKEILPIFSPPSLSEQGFVLASPSPQQPFLQGGGGGDQSSSPQQPFFPQQPFPQQFLLPQSLPQELLSPEGEVIATKIINLLFPSPPFNPSHN